VTTARKKATTRGATTRRPTHRTTRRTTARRTTRRSQPKLATTVGAALGTLLVSLLLDASWPVRITLALIVLVVVGGYLYIQGRRHDAAGAAADPDPTTPDTPREDHA